MNKMRIVSVFIVLVLLFVLWGASLQKHAQRLTLEQTVTVVAAADERPLGTLASNTTIWLDEECDDEWCYITWGKTAAKFEAATANGTVKSFKEREELPAVGSEALQVVTEAPVYATKDEDGVVIATLQASEVFTARSIGDKWASVVMPNGEGYVALTHTLTASTITLGDAVSAVKDIPIYQFDSAERRYEIGTLRANEPVEVIDTTRYYYIISFGHGEAYIAREHVEGATNDDVENIHLANRAVGSVVPAENLPVYTSMSRDANVLAILEPGLTYSTIGQWENWSIIRIGGRVGYVEQQQQQSGIAVLHYEHVLPADVAKDYESSHIIVTEEQFEEQMNYLAAQGYTTISKSNLLDYVNGRFVLPNKAVLITFDGGLLSAKEFAYPILQQRDFQAVQHVIASRVTRQTGEQQFDEQQEQYITVADFKSMADVFDHEAQTFNMHSLIGDESMLVAVDEHVMRDDFRQMVKALGTVTSFAYPFGQYSDDVIAALKEYGFTMAFTQQEGHVTIGADALTLPRYSITTATTMKQFKKIFEQ